MVLNWSVCALLWPLVNRNIKRQDPLVQGSLKKTRGARRPERVKCESKAAVTPFSLSDNCLSFHRTRYHSVAGIKAAARSWKTLTASCIFSLSHAHTLSLSLSVGGFNTKCLAPLSAQVLLFNTFTHCHTHKHLAQCWESSPQIRLNRNLSFPPLLKILFFKLISCLHMKSQATSGRIGSPFSNSGDWD